MNKVGTGKAGMDQDPDHKIRVRYWSSTFRNYTQSEPRFRALLTEGASEVELV